jgi:hypothetical protein
MLSDEELDKLRQGSIIKASLPKSSGKDDAGPHYAVILDPDEQVEQYRSHYVTGISNNDEIDPEFIMPLPSYLGLKGGYKVASWVVEVDEAGITEIRRYGLRPPDLRELLRLWHAAREARRRRSTQS